MGVHKIEIADLVGAYPTCQICGKNEIVRDAWAEWSMQSQGWILKSVFDHFSCDACGHENSPVWNVDKDFRKKRIQRLNTALRQGQGDHITIVITASLKAKDTEFLLRVQQSVASFDQFNHDNDPHGEHDFGAFEIDGEKLFWKVDYFDIELQRHSPDPANPAITHRVLTIMFASEY